MTHKTVPVARLARAFAVGPSEGSGDRHHRTMTMVLSSRRRTALEINCTFSIRTAFFFWRTCSLFLLYLIMAEAFYWSSSFIGPLHAESSLAAGRRALAERLRGTAFSMLLADLAGRASPLGFCNYCVLSTPCLSSSPTKVYNFSDC